jgi:hypothetical protein
MRKSELGEEVLHCTQDALDIRYQGGDATLALGQLIQTQEAAVRQPHLPRYGQQAAADQAHIGNRVMRAKMSREFLQQRPRFLQVRSMQPLGEPVVNLGEQLAGFGALALLLPQPHQAQRRAQLQ